MSAAWRHPRTLLAGAVAGFALWLALVLLAPRPAMQGWLIAFLAGGSVPAGALVLLLVGDLTGGRWAKAAAPTLEPAALALPWLVPAFLVLLAGAGSVYPWTHGTDAAPDVLHVYLARLPFAVRGLVALGGWSVLAWLHAAGRLGRLGAALGLVFYAATISLVAVDWALSVEPPFTSSAFGAGIAVQSVAAGLALVLAVRPERAVKDAGPDVSGLLLAACAGTLYLALMSLIVAWYGDQPDGAAWYLRRASPPMLAAGLGAVALLGPLGVALLAWESVRASPAALRAVGVAVLLGTGLHDLWLIAPAGPLALPAALLALAGGTSLALALVPAQTRLGRAVHG